MNKSCPRCKYTMNGGQDNPIPREIPLPLGLSVSIEKYFPEVLKSYKNYRIDLLRNYERKSLYDT